MKKYITENLQFIAFACVMIASLAALMLVSLHLGKLSHDRDEMIRQKLRIKRLTDMIAEKKIQSGCQNCKCQNPFMKLNDESFVTKTNNGHIYMEVYN